MLKIGELSKLSTADSLADAEKCDAWNRDGNACAYALTLCFDAVVVL